MDCKRGGIESQGRLFEYVVKVGGQQLDLEFGIKKINTY
jgi:hypothetical protein